MNIKTALYLIPCTLGESSYSSLLEQTLPSYNTEVVKQIRFFIVESKKCAIRFLKLLAPEIDIDSLHFEELNEHTDIKTIGHYLDPILKQKKSIGIISDAGCPAVADPGALVVEMAQNKNVPVIPLVGPSSMILSVMASGFNGQSFSFNGYLPVKPGDRASKIRQLENRAWNENQTQLFIEAPYRNLKMFETLLSTCRKQTRLCVAAGITTEAEFIHTHTIEEWKKLPEPPINKVPAIFLIFHG